MGTAIVKESPVPRQDARICTCKRIPGREQSMHGHVFCFHAPLFIAFVTNRMQAYGAVWSTSGIAPKVCEFA